MKRVNLLQHFNKLFNNDFQHQKNMKRERKMRFWACIRSAILLPVVLANDGVDDFEREKSYSKVRNRLPPLDSTFERSLQSNEEMGNIWEKASRMARGDIDALRLLHNADMMSMSLSSSEDGGSHRTRPPVPAPTTILTHKPTTRPTPIPTPLPTLMPIFTPMPSVAPVPILGSPSVICLESTPRNEYIFDVLKKHTPAEILMDPTTPQGKAYNYLANNDPGIIDHCSYTTLEQRYGLTTFYYAAGGDNWVDKSGWLGIQQECSWYGVVCEDDSNHVTRLLLRK